MKANLHRNRLVPFVLFLLFTNTSIAQIPGRVVINEYMTWPASACGTTSEFIELLNFGPGPVNIGCYVVTTGVYSVTIPPNTIIQPGQFYVLAGQDFISGTCANIDSSSTGIKANLNWNTCNCTNVAIPQTGAGMLADGGSANTPLVLLDPSLNIIDAVVRNTPTEAVGTVTSATLTGCTGSTFNIGTMNPNYEILGMSAGRGNSFARTMDGDCKWLKDPQQSGGASNNRSGETTDISYTLNVINPCVVNSINGNVSIYVNYSNYSQIFPMLVTLVRDANNNGIFELSDEYSMFTDNTSPYIEIDNLPVGRYRVTVGTEKGCYLQNFEFTIMSCNPGTLSSRLVYFKNKGVSNKQHQLEWLVQDIQNLQSLVVEKGDDDGKFVTEKIFTSITGSGNQSFSLAVASIQPFSCYRLKLVQKNGKVSYSSVLNLAAATVKGINKIGPNPAVDMLNIQLSSLEHKKVDYTIYNISGSPVANGSLKLVPGENLTTIPLQPLTPGTYQLQVIGLPGEVQPISFRFVKQ